MSAWDRSPVAPPAPNRRRFLALGAGVAATAALGACGGSPTRVRPNGPAVAAAERARRPAGARVVETTLTPRPGTADLGGLQVATWMYDGQLPGTAVRLRRGDVLRARLRNQLPEPTTVHWHGVALRNDMDGVPALTQPPVPPDEEFTYEFTVPDAGTYFFHSHVGMQLDRALQAPLIIDDPAEPGDYDVEAVLMLDDWLDGVAGRTPDAQLATLRREGMHMHGMSMGGPSKNAPLGADAGDVDYPHYLINGRVPADPVKVRAKPGQRVRLRLINSGSDTAFRVALGEHRLTVTHTDGFPVEPTETDALLIGMGERYDVTVTAKDGVFPLVALPEGKQGRALAYLRTASGPAPAPDGPLPAELGGRLQTVTGLTATEQARLPTREPDRTHDVVLDKKMGQYRWTINGETYGQHDPLPVERGQRVRLRFTNRTMMFHPMHLHGMTYQMARSSGSTARKDTTIVLPNQRVEVDFQADNPGQWLLHCHNTYHGMSGMATVVSYVA